MMKNKVLCCWRCNHAGTGQSIVRSSNSLLIIGGAIRLIDEQLYGKKKDIYWEHTVYWIYLDPLKSFRPTKVLQPH
jgi:hypothetical protein